MATLRKRDYTLDGSDWDLSLLSLNEAPVEDLQKNPKARRIDLSNNFLSKLPDSFTALNHLIVLDLSRNQLTSLPQSFGDLNKLIRLDLYSNQLRTLPLSFGRLSRLKWLDLKSNPLEPRLAKYAGDCVNARQCELCAINCIRFVNNERVRIESELRVKEQQLRERHELEKQLEEKNRKEKDKKKAKTARRHARKVQERVDTDADNDTDGNKRSDSSAKTANNKSASKQSWCGFLVSCLLTMAVISSTLFMALAIGLHLQKGHKLQTIDDFTNAFQNCIQSIANFEEFTKETTTLFVNIINSLSHFRQTFFDTKPNVTKTGVN